MCYLRINKRIALWGILILCALSARRSFASSADAIWPEASGADVREDNNLRLDCSHMADGYVMASIIYPSANRMKLQIVFNGMQLLYDVNGDAQYEVIPLQFGSGYYSLSLFENVGGSKYASGGKLDLSVGLTDENAPFRVPNQYVNYTRESPSVLRSDEISDGRGEAEIFETVCSLMAEEFSYDFVRAQSISPGELPEVDSCYDNRSGICQDLSAVMISMLRVQGIPSRLMIGYADGYYHAWTVSVVNGEERFFDPTAAVNSISVGSYSTERFY